MLGTSEKYLYIYVKLIIFLVNSICGIKLPEKIWFWRIICTKLLAYQPGRALLGTGQIGAVPAHLMVCYTVYPNSLFLPNNHFNTFKSHIKITYFEASIIIFISPGYGSILIFISIAFNSSNFNLVFFFLTNLDFFRLSGRGADMATVFVPRLSS